MEIVHKTFKENETSSPFSISYGEKKTPNSLQKLEKSLLDQMSSVFSIIHGGEYKKRSRHISA